MIELEVQGPFGSQLLVYGPSGLLWPFGFFDFFDFLIFLFSLIFLIFNFLIFWIEWSFFLSVHGEGEQTADEVSVNFVNL